MITCYLDSQDYSTLTDPRRVTPEHSQMREALLSFARDGKVQFVFSAAAVCEAVALTPDATHLAELKAEFLSDLCGTNALLSFDRLIVAEAVALARGNGPANSMLDPSGDWFPDIGEQEAPESPLECMRRQAEEELMAKGMSRQVSRATVRKTMFKNGKPRGKLKEYLDNLNPELLAAEYSKQYPMKPEHAAMVVKFGLGRATGADFVKALRDSLRDPRWMMKWFTTNHAMGSPIADIVRGPGRTLASNFRDLIDLAVRHAAILQELGTDSDPTGKGGEIHRRWQEQRDEQMVNLVQGIAKTKGISLNGCTLPEVERHCPGVVSMIGSLYSSAWPNVAAGRKEQPSSSLPVDAMHAIYAPYVRVFRADRYMAPHIQAQVERHGTIVVSRLSNLVEVLREEIGKFSS